MSEPAVLNYYAVLFLDVLGQRDSLRALRALPRNPREQEATLRVLQGTVGFIKTLRDYFINYFDEASRSVIDSGSLPENQRRLLKDLRRMEPKIRGFSDCAVISISLRDADKSPAAVNELFAALYGACGLASLSLSLGHALRGGVEVGLGMEVEAGEAYGPALERAAGLEARMASYPRLLVGADLLKFLQAVIDEGQKTPHQRVAAGVARECMKLVARDSDQLPILDFLGAGVREKAGTVIQTNVVRDAYTFVVREHERFASVHDVKLSGRYARLRSYFESRLALWGIEPQPSPDLATWGSTTTWDEAGFLSDQAATDAVASERSNPRWYSVAVRLSAFLHRRKYEVKPRVADPRHLIAATLLTRALSTYEAAVLLAFRGMRSETEVLLRTLLEIMFMQGALKERPETAADMIKADDFYRLRAYKGILKAPTIVPDAPDDIPAEIARLKGRVKEHGVQGIAVAKFAEWALCLEEYETIYRSLSLPAHVQLRDLSRHFKADENVILWGPEHPAARDLLPLGMQVLSKIVEDFAKILDADLGMEWVELVGEVRRLSGERITSSTVKGEAS